MKGKVILVLNGHRNQTLRDYVKQRQYSAKIFVSPETNDQNDVTGNVGGMDSKTSTFVVMNNMSKSEKEWADNVYKQKHIGRVWGNDKQSFHDQISQKTHLSAYYNYYLQEYDGYRISPMR